jgi:hypothetical protein
MQDRAIKTTVPLFRIQTQHVEIQFAIIFPKCPELFNINISFQACAAELLCFEVSAFAAVLRLALALSS